MITAPGIVAEKFSFESALFFGVLLDSHDIQMEIAADIGQMIISFDYDGFVSALKQMTCSAVMAIEIDCIGGIEAMHEKMQITRRSHKEKVKVILHQNICVHLHSIFISIGGEEF